MIANDRSFLELLAASPKFYQVLQDLKRIEKYMSDADKQRVVELVREAMKAEQ